MASFQTSNLTKKTEANWTYQKKDLRYLALVTSFKLVQKNTEPAALELSKKSAPIYHFLNKIHVLC